MFSGPSHPYRWHVLISLVKEEEKEKAKTPNKVKASRLSWHRLALGWASRESREKSNMLGCLTLFVAPSSYSSPFLSFNFNFNRLSHFRPSISLPSTTGTLISLPSLSLKNLLTCVFVLPLLFYPQIYAFLLSFLVFTWIYIQFSIYVFIYYVRLRVCERSLMQSFIFMQKLKDFWILFTTPISPVLSSSYFIFIFIFLRF